MVIEKAAESLVEFVLSIGLDPEIGFGSLVRAGMHTHGSICLLLMPCDDSCILRTSSSAITNQVFERRWNVLCVPVGFL